MENKILDEKRRTFLIDGAALLGMAAYGMITSLFADSSCEAETIKNTGAILEVDISKEPALAQVGGMVKKKFKKYNGDTPIIIIRETDVDYIVLNSACTYEGCSANLPKKTGGNIVCPCCGSEYSTSDGHVIKGPAKESLRKIDSTYDSSTKKLKITF